MINSLSTDFLIRIKNGYRAGRKTITAPASNFCISLAELMKKYGFLANYSVEGEVKKTITLNLAYDNNEPRVSDVKLFSKPGRRLYEKSSSLPWGKTPKSLIIISTSSGVMSQKEASAKGLGGELIAEIW
jgi:small subunit ribosomal protein S8